MLTVYSLFIRGICDEFFFNEEVELMEMQGPKLSMADKLKLEKDMLSRGVIKNPIF